MLQTKKDLEAWYSEQDPWKYEKNPEDLKRKKILLSEIPNLKFSHTLDIGCGNGFITKDLPGNFIKGIDISANAIQAAKKSISSKHITFEEKDIFSIHKNESKGYDLVIITGLLYEQYIGSSSNLIFLLIDQILNKNGILLTVHIDSWYHCRFPYNLFYQRVYPYKTYLHKLEVYQK